MMESEDREKPLVQPVETAEAGAGRLPPLTPEMVGFRLLKLTNLLSRPFFGRFAKQHALTINEWRTIVVLANHPGSAAQDISAATGLHPMNISRALAGLRKSGRVEEARDPLNHRRVLLWLTAAGRQTFREIAPYSERQAQQLLDSLSATELAALSGILDKLTVRAERIAADAG
ncbi:MAG TPA: MarR family winged helix-turn-helix transcriptional regulator [Rubrivivax sp.]|jgi:DNA-binding MarR family transcriptional regulator|nr:MarR family winged helix-turn-helix transcriptional regulator [Burkholderiaceae bacterium]HMQ72735.1 MarR family winged helix-turn-helix transcriptional regulator [Rubrivivax sp.]HMR70226.1 MarR family winged helix-turn-helix transcriptional regulator [Rubrivivax sp.]